MTLTIILLVLALLTAVVSSLWMTVNAFRASVPWGLAFMFLPFASLVFLFNQWELARRPFYLGLFTIFFFLAAKSTMPADADKRLAELFNLEKDGKSAFDMTPKTPGSKPRPKLPAMFAAQKEAELKIRLVALQKRENDLLDRKAALAPNDRAGALALTEEIKRYNDDLKPVLTEMRERGMDVAGR
jgi:hypothetical protein